MQDPFDGAEWALQPSSPRLSAQTTALQLVTAGPSLLAVFAPWIHFQGGK